MSRIKAFLKHLFVPHEGNDHQPHMLRNAAIALLIGIALLAEGGLFVDHSKFIPNSKLLGIIINSTLVDQTNEQREDAALNTLRVNPVLVAAAQMKANDMAAKSYFAHTSPEGITPWHWFDQAGYNYAYAGENLAVDFTDSKDVTDAWMRSPLHRANILNSHFTEVGIATAHGTFEGHEADFVVQLFGTPAAVAAAPVAPVIKKSVAVRTPAPEPALPAVLGASAGRGATTTTTTTTPPFSQENAIAAAEATTTVSSTAVAAANETPQTPAVSRASYDLFANPRRATNALVLIFLLLVFAALAIKIFHVGFMYPHLIRNGVLAAMIFLAVLTMNHALLSHLQIF